VSVLSGVTFSIASIASRDSWFDWDGAYDSVTLTNAILSKQPDASIVVPPTSNAVMSQEGNTQRDQHIRLLEEVGRIAW